MAYTLTNEEFRRKLDSMPSLAEKNARKDQSDCLSMHAAMISGTQGRLDARFFNNALLIWSDTGGNRFNHSAITKSLSLSYRSEKLIFVRTNSKVGEFSALIRFNIDVHRLGLGMNDAKNLANYLSLGSKETHFELLMTNLPSPEFVSKFNEIMDQGWICAALGCLPREHQGFRDDIESAHPTTELNSHFGSIAAGSTSSRSALVDSAYVHRFTKRAISRIMQTQHTPAYGEDSPAAAKRKGSDNAERISQAFSLWIGVPVRLEAQFISGSDANNFLSCFGKVAIGDGSYGAGRGDLRELSSRSFLLQYLLQNGGKPSITDVERELRVWKLPYGDFF